MNKPKMIAIEIMAGKPKGESDMSEDMCECPKCGHMFKPEMSSDMEEDYSEEED